MTYVDLAPDLVTRETFSGDSRDVALADVSAQLFSSLPRSDQHQKGIYYLRGLLEAEGRKSIRAIAALFDGVVSEQNLHHFIASSTWDWVPMRRALAEHLVTAVRPQAWVAQLMIIPKSGHQSVGVERHFFPGLGQVLNAQRAIGLWAASEKFSVPFNWRLHLPKNWLKDDLKRSRVAIPYDVGPENLTECVIGACAESILEWDLPVRPLVIDMCEAHPVAIFREFAEWGIPLMVRVGRDVRLTVTDPLLPAIDGCVLPAGRVMDRARDLRRPVSWSGSSRAHLAATVRVALPAGAATSFGDLALLGVADAQGRGRPELWLTNMASAQPAYLVHLSKLTEKIDRDVGQISDRVGIRDFTGRSFGGWHRHVTLASAAHAIMALTGRTH
ncbi:IS701 family transposase [Streptomyces turgidiscabies]|uniref:Transposase IS701-like DDE domain-containing protein n=1 Tax=Streptomyces turgidiscabies TaxID=85558 RepID=A0ABU0RFK6_9ACTN|nr:transposase [Streptomyces turgidiscabies]MDQ0930749.1 hypothetical protein [Streptomyces turgidiscabies]